MKREREGSHNYVADALISCVCIYMNQLLTQCMRWLVYVRNYVRMHV